MTGTTIWKRLTDRAALDEKQPFWSPDGRFLYFLSEQDGYRCAWAVRFDPATSKPVQEPFAAQHLHQFRHSLLDFPNVADIGLSLAGKTMFLAFRETRQTSGSPSGSPRRHRGRDAAT